MGRRSQNEKKLRKKVGNATKDDFKRYKPLTEGLRKDSLLSLMINMSIMIRQLVRLYMSMFFTNYVWLQVMVFMVISLVSLTHIGFTRPYTSRK